MSEICFAYDIIKQKHRWDDFCLVSNTQYYLRLPVVFIVKNKSFHTIGMQQIC